MARQDSARINFEATVCYWPEKSPEPPLEAEIRPAMKNLKNHKIIDRAVLRSLSVDDLWELHDAMCEIITEKLNAEKMELERKLAQLVGPVRKSECVESRMNEARPDYPNEIRRYYPAVVPKYRHPDNPSQTWSGRGKLPRWLATEIKSGRKLEEFLIELPTPN